MSKKTQTIGLTLTTDGSTLFKNWRETINGEKADTDKSNAQLIDDAFKADRENIEKKEDKFSSTHKLSAEYIDGELGTKVVANPEDAATESLTKIKIGDDVFSVEGGSSETPVLFRHDLTYSGSCNDDDTQRLNASVVMFSDSKDSYSLYQFAKWLKNNDYTETTEYQHLYPATGTITTDEGDKTVTGVMCGDFDEETADIFFYCADYSGYVPTAESFRYTFTDKVNDKFATDIKTIEGQSLLGTGNVDLHTPSTLKYETSESFSQHVLQEGESVTSIYFNLTDEYKTFMDNYIMETLQTLQNEGFTKGVHYTQESNPQIYAELAKLYDGDWYKDHTLQMNNLGHIAHDEDEDSYYLEPEEDLFIFGSVVPKLNEGEQNQYFYLATAVMYGGLLEENNCVPYFYMFLEAQVQPQSQSYIGLFTSSPRLAISDDIFSYCQTNKPSDLSEEGEAIWTQYFNIVKDEVNNPIAKSIVADESIRYSFNEPFSIKAKGIGLRDKNNNEVGDRVSLKTINNTELFGEGNIEIAGGTTVEANPTEEATTDLEKIKIGEEVFNVAVDTSDLATKDDIDYVMGFVNYLLGKHNEAIVDTVQYEDGTTGTKLKTVDEEGNESFIIVGGN